MPNKISDILLKSNEFVPLLCVLKKRKQLCILGIWAFGLGLWTKNVHIWYSAFKQARNILHCNAFSKASFDE